MCISEKNYRLHFLFICLHTHLNVFSYSRFIKNFKRRIEVEGIQT